MTPDDLYRLEHKGYDALIDAVEFFVEATHYEKHSLWYRWDYNPEKDGVYPKWASGGSFGRGEYLGYLDGMPVLVMTMFQLIGGRLVGFYEVTSQVADFRMVDKWLDRVCYAKGKMHSDPMNFGHVLNEIERRNEGK
jgi:hypothetical protein